MDPIEALENFAHALGGLCEHWMYRATWTEEGEGTEEVYFSRRETEKERKLWLTINREQLTCGKMAVAVQLGDAVLQ